MKLGVLADVHGNKPALDAVLGALDEHDVDAIVCVGDIVGVLGWPNETVSTIRNAARAAVYGNHDLRVFPDVSFLPTSDVEVAEYEQVTESLTEENLDWLTSCPGITTVDDGSVTLAHCRPNPDDPAGFHTDDRGVPPRRFTKVGSQHVSGGILLLAHTHFQHAVNLDKFQGQSGLIVNPGAVGHPYEKGRADYAVVDIDTQTYELASVEYDAGPVKAHLRDAGLL